jgi:anaerobic ribonucleoside-triphosphate reductase activating protein
MPDRRRAASTSAVDPSPEPSGELPVTDPRTVRVARVVTGTSAEGPGIRTAIWVQGCTVRCPTCFNPQLWARNGGQDTLPADLATAALATDDEGVTFLGGEPFDQAAGLAVAAEILRKEGRSVVTFTGYPLERLRAAAAQGRRDVAQLLETTDLLIDGPYLAAHPDRLRPWVGSTNQRFHALSPRYQSLVGSLGTLPDRLELRISAEGHIAVNGWAGSKDLETILDLL